MQLPKKKWKLIFDLVFGVAAIVCGALMLYNGNYRKPLGTVFVFCGLMAFIYLIKRRWIRIVVSVVNVAVALLIFYFYGRY